MKRIFSMLACAALVVCSCQKDPKPALSFETGNYVMGADEALTVKVVTTQAPATDLTVEFTAAGSAVKGTDYAFSAESFTIKAGETVGEITVTPLNNLGENLTIDLALTLPVGYEAGKFTSALIAVGTKEKFSYSFAKKETKLVSEVDIILNLIGENSGANFVAGGDFEFPFIIDALSSALETDYEVKDNATKFVVAKGTNSAKITLVSKVTTMPETEKNIVISLDASALAQTYGDRVTPGVITSTTSTIAVLTVDGIEGKWAYASTPILDDPTADFWTLGGLLDEAGDGGINDEFTGIVITNFPTATSSDILEFKNTDGKLSLMPTGSGSIMNFFKECEITGISAAKYNWYFYKDSNPMGKEYDVLKTGLSAANITYSSTKETISEANILLSLSEDGNTLHVFITDYIPTDFFTNTYAFFGAMWSDLSFYYDLYFTFTRVTE